VVCSEPHETYEFAALSIPSGVLATGLIQHGLLNLE
jgi:hypothetical protein